MNPNKFFVMVVGFITLQLISEAGQLLAESPSRRPNIILIMADDLGWRDTGYNGSPIAQTPNLDAMAAAGLRFNRFYAAAPVCSPTRGSCLTGRHPFRYGIFNANVGHLKQQEYTIAEHVKALGYQTGHFGKWHLGTMTKTIKDSNRGGSKNAKHYSPPSQHGFHFHYATEAKVPTFDPLLKPGNARRTYWLPIEPDAGVGPYGTRYWSKGKVVESELRGDDSEIIMNEALNFIEKNNKSPFLSVIWFHAPHLPVVASDSDRAAFKNLDPYSQSYFGCIRALDRQVGRLRKHLRQTGLAKNTILFFCSDNGPEGNQSAPGSAAPLRGRKRSFYEGGIRVPGIIEWPDQIPTAVITDFPAVTSDYLPTLLDITGGSLPDERPLDGISLLPLIKNPKLLVRNNPIFFQSANQATMIADDFKLIGKVQNAKTALSNPELYRISRDPSESQDVSSQHPEIVKQMQMKLANWRDSCKNSLVGKDYRR